MADRAVGIPIVRGGLLLSGGTGVTLICGGGGMDDSYGGGQWVPAVYRVVLSEPQPHHPQQPNVVVSVGETARSLRLRKSSNHGI